NRMCLAQISIPILGYVAVSPLLEQFSLLVIAAVLVAILFRKRFTKPTAEDPPVRLYSARFNQRFGTPKDQLRHNPVRRYASCHCLDAQYEPEPSENEGEVEGEAAAEHATREWQELCFHTEMQDTSSDAWNTLEAYIEKVRADESDALD